MPVELRGVSHTYDGHRWVLLNVDLRIEEGRATAIVGPSGSGKSSLLAVAGGLLKPTRGEALLTSLTRPDGISVPARIAWVFQTMNLLPRRSAADNVAIGRLAVGGSRRDAMEAAHEALASMDLDAYADRPCYSLSGGEQQRVCIARALVSRPSVILADEPTGNLDRTTSTEVARLMLSTRPANTALLIATHDPSVAELCDRVLVLFDGQLEAKR
jgi:ABC-type lipoprotein export system ATPase subunit